MTSLSNGIYRSDSKETIRLSELPLEPLTPGKKRDSSEIEAVSSDKKEKKLEDSYVKEEDDSWRRELASRIEGEKEEADYLLREAREQSSRILEEAKAQAEKIKIQAGKEGYVQGWKKGSEEAAAKVQQEADEQREQEKRVFQESLSAALHSITSEKEACLKRYLDELKDVAIAVGEKVIRISLRSCGSVIQRMIETETEKLNKIAWVRIYMERGDYEAMIQADAEALAHLAKLSDNVKFVVMEQASGGSCIIEMPDEIIDISVDTQMENIRKLLGNIHF